MQLAMERENDFHMNKYLRRHLRREPSAEKNLGGRSSEPHSNPGKGCAGHLKHTQETFSSNGKGSLIFSTMVLLTTKVDLAMRPTVMGEAPACCNFSASRRPRMVKRCNTKINSAARLPVDVAASVHITRMIANQNTASPKNTRKRRKNARRTAEKVTLMGDAVTLGDPLVRGTLVEDEGPQPLRLMKGGPLTLPPKVRGKFKRKPHLPRPQALAVPTRARTPRSVSSIGTPGS